jgi:predicted ABC-type ATPase
MNTSRLRLVAGPNGAGKSTFTEEVLKKYVNLGVYVNPDEIAKTVIGEELFRAKEAQQVAIRQREQLLREGQSMTYESVMSHPSHLDFLKQAKEKGYRTYLYFIGVQSPSISEDRVKEREKNGGHGVPKEKIAPRYNRVMNQLSEACSLVDRAYIFDNSITYSLVAEIHNCHLCIHSDNPATQLSWVKKYLFEKLNEK